LKEAALVLGVSTATVRRLVWQSRLPVVKFNRRVLVDVKDVDKFIESSKERSGP
jgi:excisionase family DNA binding protein